VIVTKRALPRRTFLKGAGAAIGLPLLDAMVPAFAAEAPKAKRIGFVYLPNGVAKNYTGIDYWTPKSTGKLAELSTILAPLTPYRSAKSLSEARNYPLISVDGGSPATSDACEAQSPHGYLGKEAETVEAMVNWALKKPFAANIN